MQRSVSNANQTSSRAAGGSCGSCSRVFLIAAGGGAWWWFSRERPVEVETATVSSRQAGTQAAVLNATGYVTARRRATVSSKITGKVIEVNIEEGMAVRQGQVLARLDAETQSASVALAEAQAEAARRNVNESEVRLNEARINLDRISKLVGVGYSTAAEVDAARAAVDSLEARIQRRPRAGAGGRAPGRVGTDQSRQHCYPRALCRGRDLKGCAARRDGFACLRRRRVYEDRYRHDRRHGLARDRSRRQRELHQSCETGTGSDRRAGRVSGLADTGARHHDDPVGRPSEGHGAGPDRIPWSSIRAFCPTWASR